MARFLFTLKCPDCGHITQEGLDRLQDSPRLVCPGCGAENDVNLRDEHGIEMTTKFGPLQVIQGARGSVSISVEVYHPELNKHRLVRGPEAELVKTKAFLQAAEWNEAWAKKVAAKQQTTLAERRARRSSRQNRRSPTSATNAPRRAVIFPV